MGALLQLPLLPMRRAQIAGSKSWPLPTSGRTRGRAKLEIIERSERSIGVVPLRFRESGRFAG